MPARSSMYFVCFSSNRSAILSTWQIVPIIKIIIIITIIIFLNSFFYNKYP